MTARDVATRSARSRGGPVRIGLLGMYASRNLGDTAIQSEVMRNLRVRVPGCVFVGICADPADTVATHAIDAVRTSGYWPALRADGSVWQSLERPWPRSSSFAVGSRRILKVIRELDLLVMSGGGQLEDYWGGAGNQPRYLLTWTLLARLVGVPVVYFSVGLDQLSSSSGRRRVMLALRAANQLSFRDQGSIDLLQQAGLRAQCDVVPDPALGLAPLLSHEAGPGDARTVVVSPISYRVWLSRPDARYSNYLGALAAACQHWLERGLALRFACSQIEMDPPAVDELLARIPAKHQARVEFVRVRTVEEFRATVAHACFVVASRLHGAVLAASVGTPILAVSPARKVTQLMQDFGLGEYCVPLDDVSPQRLVMLGDQLAGPAGIAVRTRLAEATARARGRLAAAYDRLAEWAARP